MTKARFLPLTLFVWAAPIFWSFSALSGLARPVEAAPSKGGIKASPPVTIKGPRSGAITLPGTGPAPLTFNVTARITATGMNAGPAQTLKAQVALNGPKARVQTLAAGQPVVVLFSPPYVYRLLPKSKAGVRWKLSSNKSSMGAFDPQQLLRDPTQIRATLLAGGAKKTGSGPLNGVPTEIYEIKAPGKGQGTRIQGLKVWLRRADALPLRLVANGPGVQVVASWSSYARPTSLSSVYFTPPANYRIRDVRSAPPLAGL